MLPDLSNIPDLKRQAFANRVRVAKDFDLPELKYFNSSPCKRHASLAEGAASIPPCQDCGISFRRHQRVGVTWLYMAKRGLIADQVGTGKTIQAAGLLAAVKEIGELEQGGRVVIVCRAAALIQWYQQLARMLPHMHITTATGEKRKRIEKYLQPWEICLISQQMLLSDVDALSNFNVHTLIIDDVDALRNRDNKTAWAIKQLGRQAERVVILTGTPLQKRLHELHSVLEPIGGGEILGSERNFRKHFVRTEQVKWFNPRMGKYMWKAEIVGYKNLDTFKQLISPITLRRTADDIDDVDLPVINPVNVFLDLYPAQRKRYAELRRGALKLIKSGEVKLAKASSVFLHGQQICGGLAALGEPDGPNTSVKLDWVMDKLTGDLEEEKVVVFIHFKDNVRALQARLKKEGIDFVTIWGDEPNAQVRYQAQQRFWNDPKCKVLIGTLSIEQSLNLQCSRHLICVDIILNAARMTQLAGRIRRDGSAYKSLYVYNLLTTDTQEDNYLDVLNREQALADYVWSEQSDLYDGLSPLALMELVGGTYKSTTAS